jgi:DNA-directed RNA polymerase specialized sigma24 family protein
LSEGERQLVERHYFRGEAFNDIAESLGISKSWASRMHAKALLCLREALTDREPVGRDPLPGMVPKQKAMRHATRCVPFR